MSGQLLISTCLGHRKKNKGFLRTHIKVYTRHLKWVPRRDTKGVLPFYTIDTELKLQSTKTCVKTLSPCPFFVTIKINMDLEIKYKLTEF